MDSDETYIIVDEVESSANLGETGMRDLDITVYYINSCIDMTGTSCVNASYGEQTLTYGIGTDEGSGTFAAYYFETESTGTYNLWIDNIEISKDKESYAENNLFDINIYDYETYDWIAGKEIFVNGEDTYVSFDCEEGKNYIIELSARTYGNSEKYRNGDVSYSLHLEESQDADITGYTKVRGEINCAGQMNTYTMTPFKKQTIDISLSEMEENAKVNVNVLDSSGNIINTFEGLTNSSSFSLKDAMQNNTYTIQVTGTEKTEYVMSVSYE